MNKKLIVFLIAILVITGAAIATKQKQNADRIEQQKIAAMAIVREEKRKARAAAEALAKQKALEKAKRKAEEALRIAKQKAMEEARKKAAELKAKVAGLVERAQSLLAEEKYQDAVNIAQSILSLDDGNVGAQSIIETAGAKLKEIAEKEAELLRQATEKTVESIADGVPIAIPGQ